jgi:hypothetical protein
MHTAGTRFFGTVVIDTVSNTNVGIASHSLTANTVEILPISPLTVEDRQDIYVQDRGVEYIEIRD